MAHTSCGTERGYQRHRRYNEPICDSCRDARNAARRAREATKPRKPRPDTTAQRFWAKVDGGDVSACWEWTAYRDPNGYGRFNVGGRAGGMDMAHRVAWRLLRGDIPDGLQLDHLCFNRSCVNPWHLEPVTALVNSQRSTAGTVNAARQRAISWCPKGHPYDAENTGYRADGRRRCKACDRAAAAERRAS